MANNYKLLVIGDRQLTTVLFLLSCALVALWLKNPRNLRNPWLINDLHACMVLYKCSVITTNVMILLQINLFMQNEPNLPDDQMNVSSIATRDYDKKDTWWSGKKQSQTKPNKPKFKKAKMNVTSIITKDYERILNWAICENKANFNPKQTQTKPNKPNLSRRRLWRSRNKPNFKTYKVYLLWNQLSL